MIDRCGESKLEYIVPDYEIKGASEEDTRIALLFELVNKFNNHKNISVRINREQDCLYIKWQPFLSSKRKRVMTEYLSTLVVPEEPE